MVLRLLVAVASLVAEPRLGAQPSVVAVNRLSCSKESSDARDQNHVPCIVRWISNHWITRYIPVIKYFR